MENCLLTEVQTSEILNINPSTLRRWRFEGKGPGHIKIGRAVRYDPEIIKGFIEVCKKEGDNYAIRKRHLRKSCGKTSKEN